jgi:hypothetical protein
MSINLPGYGTAGWGATLNNYLRNLEKRLNVIEGKVNNNTTVEEQILAVSRYAGSGLTSTSTTIKHKDSSDAEADVTETYALSDLGGKLIFKNLSYYIAASLTNSGGSHITFDTDKEWVYDSSSLGSTNQSLLLVIDQYGAFSLLPHIVNGNPTNTSATNLNFCRLGYVTKIGDSIYFTPAPEIASINTSSKFDFWSSPKIKTERQNSNSEAIGDFTFNAEGLGYYKNAKNVSNILINDFDILNSLTYENVSDYYAIAATSSGASLNYVSSFASSVDDLSYGNSNNFIRVYYATLIGKVFCCIYSLNSDDMPITSQELGSYQLNRQDNGAKLLFENYRYICPVEVFRLAKNKYGTIISYSNTYNGFSPQLHNTPVFGSNNLVKWNQFHFMQESAATEDKSSYNTLSIRPIVNSGEGAINSVVTIDTTSSTTTENNEILLMNHNYDKELLISTRKALTLEGKYSDCYKIEILETIDDSDTKTENYTVTLSSAPEGHDQYFEYTQKKIIRPTLSAFGNFEIQSTTIKLDYPIDHSGCLVTCSNSLVTFNQTTTSEGIVISAGNITSGDPLIFTITYTVKPTTYGYCSIDLDNNVTKVESVTTTNGKISNYTFDKNSHCLYVEVWGLTSSQQVSVTSVKEIGYNQAIHHIYDGEITFGNENSKIYSSDSETLKIYGENNIEIESNFIKLGQESNYLRYSYADADYPFLVQGNTKIQGTVHITDKTTIDNNLDVGGVVTWTSDRNYKTNITPLSFDSIHIIDSIPLYNYALKSIPDKQTIGLMAQDLQQHLPQLVHTAEDGRLTIEETKLVYVCMDALKKANERIVILEDKVNDLCNKISQYHL